MCLSAWWTPTKDETAQSWGVFVQKKKQLCAFSCKPGDCPDGFHHVCVVRASVKSREKSVEEAGDRAAEWTKVSASLCTEQTLVETLDLMQVHCFDFKSFMLTLLLFQYCFLKGKGYTSSEDILCLKCFHFFFSKSKIIYLLRFKLFLTIFKCIYVSFFTLTVCRF